MRRAERQAGVAAKSGEYLDDRSLRPFCGHRVEMTRWRAPDDWDDCSAITVCELRDIWVDPLYGQLYGLVKQHGEIGTWDLSRVTAIRSLDDE